MFDELHACACTKDVAETFNTQRGFFTQKARNKCFYTLFM